MTIFISDKKACPISSDTIDIVRKCNKWKKKKKFN